MEGALAQADGIMNAREMLAALVPVPKRRPLKVGKEHPTCCYPRLGPQLVAGF